MRRTRTIKFKKSKVNEKNYGYGIGMNSGRCYSVVSDGTIVGIINKLCDKYNAEIKQICLTDEIKNIDELEDCFIKIKAYKRDFMNIVNDFSLYLLKWISNIRY